MAAAVLGLWGGVATWRSRRGQVAGLPRLSSAVFGTALVIAGPELAAAFSTRHISPNNATLALALTPAVVAVLCSAVQEASGGDLAGLLWPGLGGLAGLLLLVPEPSLPGWRPWTALAAMPLLTGYGAHLLSSQDLTREPTRQGAGVWGCSFGCGLAGAVFVSLRALELAKGDVSHSYWSAACLDGIGVVLSLLALTRLGAARWSAQFLLIPFVALIEGVLLLRPILNVRSWIGLALLLLGAARLLAWRTAEPSIRLDL